MTTDTTYDETPRINVLALRQKSTEPPTPTDPGYAAVYMNDSGELVAKFHDGSVSSLLVSVPDPFEVGDIAGTSVTVEEEYTEESHSHQSIAADLTVGALVGSDDGANPKFIAAAMFNLLGADLTKDANYLAGVIGAYSITGTKATTYPAGAVLGQITDGVSEADGAFVAYIDGDSSQTNAGAAYKVRSNNSDPDSGFDFGVDLQDDSHDGYQPVDAAFYKKAPVRLVGDVCLLVSDTHTAADGADVCGPGSLLFDKTGKKLYVNTGSKAVPTWTVVGTQS